MTINELIKLMLQMLFGMSVYHLFECNLFPALYIVCEMNFSTLKIYCPWHTNVRLQRISVKV